MGKGLTDCIRVLRHFDSQGHIMVAGDVYVFPGFLTPVLTQLSFQSHQQPVSHALEVRGKNVLQRKFALTYRTHNHQVGIRQAQH